MATTTRWPCLTGRRDRGLGSVRRRPESYNPVPIWNLRTARTMKRRMVISLAFLLITPVAVLAIISGIGRRPDNLGVHDSQLAACPDTPNCVSTRARTPQHAIEPIPFTGSVEQVMQQLRSVVESQPGATIVTAGGSYLYAEFKSRILRFVDDVEFFVDEGEQAIHFRSSSRVGYSDLGADRRRMETLRTLFEQNVKSDDRQANR